MHNAKNFPFRKEKSDLDLALDDGVEDEEYLRILAVCSFPEKINGKIINRCFYLDAFADFAGHIQAGLGALRRGYRRSRRRRSGKIVSDRSRDRKKGRIRPGAVRW